MNDKKPLLCILHENAFIALCLTCGEMLCLDCLFDHQKFKDHQYEKLEKLKEKYQNDLKKYKDYLLESQKKIRQANEKETEANIHENLQKIDQFHSDIKTSIDLQFQILKDEFQELNRSFSNIPSQSLESQKRIDIKLKQLDDFLKFENEQDLFEIHQFLQEKEQEKNIKETILERIPSKENLHLSIRKEFFISKLQSLLRQSLNFIEKKVNIADTPNKSTILPWFLENTSLLYIYDIKEKKVCLFQIKDFVIPYNHKVVVTDFNQIFLIGGIKSENDAISNETFNFESKNSTMRSKFNMKFARHGHAVCYFRNSKEEYIYCIGGKSQDERLSSIERYNVNENTWKLLQKMNNARVGASACCNQKKIFVFGGIKENETICKSVDIFLISENKWESFNLINDFLYEPTIDSTCHFVTEKEIIIVGGARKENNDVYFTNNVIFLNIEENFVFMSQNTNKQDFPYYFLGDLLTIYEKNIYMLVKMRTESKKYGPFQKALITLDLGRNIWKFDQLIESESLT